MKRVIVTSDSHGMDHRLRLALCHAFEQGPVDVLAFLGDGCRDFAAVSQAFLEHQPSLQVYAVRGNTDWSSSAPLSNAFTLEGISFFMCHGHQYQVKQGLALLSTVAAEQGARIALFGHTHQGFLSSEYGCTLINPGAICSYGEDLPLYADIRIDKEGAVKAELILQAVIE